MVFFVTCDQLRCVDAGVNYKAEACMIYEQCNELDRNIPRNICSRTWEGNENLC